jgi:hypothetical protein
MRRVQCRPRQPVETGLEQLFSVHILARHDVIFSIAFFVFNLVKLKKT